MKITNTKDKDNDELNTLLTKPSSKNKVSRNRPPSTDEACEVKSDEAEDRFTSKSIQWSTSNGTIFIPTGSTCDELVPGIYEIGVHPSIGLYFDKIPAKTEGIIDFPEAKTHKVIEEIQKFWDREQIFRDFKLAYKRGIILWGPPGGGKSATLQLVSRDVIKRGGIVIKFDNPTHFSGGYRKLREIQPDTPIIVLMEDIDSTISHYSETEVINILDGVDRMDKVVFLATTNYPEELGDRIMNRPSRFDKRFKVGFPSEGSRKLYFEHLKDGHNELDMDIDKWVSDTENFTIAHMKELFVAVIILGDDYNQALETLKSMKTHIRSSDDTGVKLGFRDTSD